MQKIMNSFAILASLTLIPSLSSAAPHPGATIVSPKIGVYRSPLGFQIAAADTNWRMELGSKDSKYVATVFKAPGENKSAALTVRVDQLEKDISLDNYMQKWLREYPRFGFDILGSKPFMQSSRRGYVVDLINRENKKQMRQVVFLSPKKKSAVILTCRDQMTTFKDSLKHCNSIIRSFDWKD